MRGLSKLYRVAINAFLPVDQRNLLLPVHTYPDIFKSAIFSFRFWLSSTRIRWIRHTNPQLFEFVLQNGNFWIRYESRIKWTLKIGICQGHLYREYCIQDGYLDACSVSNIPSGVLGNRNNPDMCRIRVDGQIRFECGYVWENQG